MEDIDAGELDDILDKALEEFEEEELDKVCVNVCTRISLLQGGQMHGGFPSPPLSFCSRYSVHPYCLMLPPTPHS